VLICSFWLLLLLVELFCELLDLPSLTRNVARGVMYQASRATVITAGRLSPHGPRPPLAATVRAPASGWLLPPAFFFLFLLLLPSPWASGLLSFLAPRVFVKTKKYEDEEKNKILACICGEESCISLIILIYKIHNSQTCLPSSSALMLKEKSNFRDCMIRRFLGPCKRSSLG
jgi:hypothetical protein